jgi:histidine kinase
VQNFLSNAINYTDRGRVTLGCRRRGDVVSIEVWDTGAGIPEDKQQLVFEEFTRLDTGVDRDSRSTGLGLSIVDRVAGLLGHSVRLRSIVGKGSVFSIEVPRATSAGHSPDENLRDAPEHSPFAQARIWYLGQADFTCESTLRLLQKWECEAQVILHVPDFSEHAANMTSPDLLLVGNIGASSKAELLTTVRAHCQPFPTVILFQDALDKTLDMPLVKQLPNPPPPSALRAVMMQAILSTAQPL